MNPGELGILGRLEAARQALEEAGRKGMTFRQVIDMSGKPYESASRGTHQAFFLQLTRYCAIYESDDGRRFYLNEEMDASFNRRIIIGNQDILEELQDDE